MFFFSSYDDVFVNLFTCVAIEAELYAVSILGANNVASSEERRIAVVEGYSSEVEGCVNETEEKQGK